MYREIEAMLRDELNRRYRAGKTVIKGALNLLLDGREKLPRSGRNDWPNSTSCSPRTRR